MLSNLKGKSGTVALLYMKSVFERWRGAEGQPPILIETVCLNCDHDERMAEYRKTGVLSSKILMAAALYMNDLHYQTGGADGGWVEWMRGADRAQQRIEIGRRIRDKANFAADYRKIHEASKAVQAAVKMFERAVWFRWLKDYWHATRERGHEAKIPSLTMMLWGCAGRAMATISDPATKASVTVITDDSSSEPRMGTQSIDATREDALRLLALAYYHTDDLRLAMRPDSAVKLAGL
jgi:hypothetical protein